MSASDNWTSRVPRRCREMVHPLYDRRAGRPPHQCWNGAAEDEYCKRHHPKFRLALALKRRERLRANLEATEQLIREMRERLSDKERRNGNMEKESEMSEQPNEVLRDFCKSLVRQYDRLIQTGQHNLGAALCVVQKWEIEKVANALAAEQRGGVTLETRENARPATQRARP